MENMSRRDMLKGAVAAAAAVGVAGIASTYAPEIAEAIPYAEEDTHGTTRNDGPGFNAGWGDSTIEDYSGMSFDEVIDSWFNYDWNYSREFEEPLERHRVCILDDSASIGGNGDTLVDIVVDEIGDQADVEVIYLRNLNIGPVMQIGQEPPVLQRTTYADGLETVVEALHKADTVIAVAPTYFNNIHGRLMETITRTWSPCWKNDSYQYGPVKRTGVMLTCTGCPPDYLKTVTRAFFTMADLSIISPEYRTEVFPGCGAPDTVLNKEEYQEQARALARWAIRAE